VASVGMSTHPVTALAAGEVIGQLLDAGARHADLVVVGVTPAHGGALEDVAATVARLVEPTVLVATVATDLLAVAAGAPVASGSGRREAAGPAPGSPGPAAVAALAAAVGPVGGRVLPAGADECVPSAPFEPAATLVFGATTAAGPTLRRACAPDGSPAPVVLGGCGPGPVALGRRVAGTGAAVAADLMTAPAVGSAVGLRPLGAPLPVDDVDGRVLLRLGGAPAFDRLVDQARDGVAASELPELGAGLHLERLGPDGRADGAPIPVLGRQAGGSGLALARPVAAGELVRLLVRDAAALRRAGRSALQALGGGPATGAPGPPAVLVIGPPGLGRALGGERDPALPPTALLLELPVQTAPGGDAGGPLQRAGVNALGLGGGTPTAP
jgi:hypothetical protein